jgi:hypothetical protein
MTCTSQHLGYGTTADHVQCALAHTGLALWPAPSETQVKAILWREIGRAP